MRVITLSALLGAVFLCLTMTLVDASFQCPDIEDPCMNRRSLLKCRRLVKRGCENIKTLESCPLQFKCIDGEDEDFSCPDITDGCMNEKNSRQCQELVQSGCQNIAVAKSCPLQFTCNDDDLFSCPGISDGCMNEDNLQECQQLVQTGCHNIVTLRSCPLQFMCQDDFHCPEINDACMTGGNWRQCQAMFQSGRCGSIEFSDTCPLQFKCVLWGNRERGMNDMVMMQQSHLRMKEAAQQVAKEDPVS